MIYQHKNVTRYPFILTANENIFLKDAKFHFRWAKKKGKIPWDDSGVLCAEARTWSLGPSPFAPGSQPLTLGVPLSTLTSQALSWVRKELKGEHSRFDQTSACHWCVCMHMNTCVCACARVWHYTYLPLNDCSSPTNYTTPILPPSCTFKGWVKNLFTFFPCFTELELQSPWKLLPPKTFTASYHLQIQVYLWT